MSTNDAIGVSGLPVRIISREFCTKEWAFPIDKFIKYGPEDESYCRYFGIGYERIKRIAVIFKGVLYVDPDTYQALVTISNLSELR